MSKLFRRWKTCLLNETWVCSSENAWVPGAGYISMGGWSSHHSGTIYKHGHHMGLSRSHGVFTDAEAAIALEQYLCISTKNLQNSTNWEYTWTEQQVSAFHWYKIICILDNCVPVKHVIGVFGHSYLGCVCVSMCVSVFATHNKWAIP